MPPQVIIILSWLNLALRAAPAVAQFYENARGVFQMLFERGLITAEQQNALRAWSEQHEAAALAGEVPPEFTVEADPK